MNTLIAFVRAAPDPVDPVGALPLSRLRAPLESLGLAGVRGGGSGGPVIFETDTRATPALVRTIEAQLAAALDRPVRVFLRSLAELEAVAQHRPFDAAAQAAARALDVGFLAEPLSAASIARLMDLRGTVDQFHVHGRELYWLCRTRRDRSRFSPALCERVLRVPAAWCPLRSVRRLVERLDMAPAVMAAA